VNLREKAEIEAFLRRDPLLHIYGIGDLDPFYWSYTSWYGLRTDAALHAIVLLYTGGSPPTMLALGRETEPLCELVASIRPRLPSRFYCHLSPGVNRILAPHYTMTSQGVHWKMGLSKPERIEEVKTGEVVGLGPGDGEELLRFYRDSYPGNWFDPRMLETGCYCGIREGDELVSVSGIHLFSPEYRVAALGNIATRPDRRGRGLGLRVTAALCRRLLQEVDHVGLNVRADNRSAIRIYERLGFERVSEYEEFEAEAFLGEKH
jgi:ribosomal protein S18 acetylase RimI-like enzyme